MKRKTAGRVAKPRKCALCGGLMPASKPVFLVGEGTGGIVGPYHSGCAAKLVEAHKGKPEMPGPNAAQSFGEWPSRRELTLPW